MRGVTETETVDRIQVFVRTLMRGRPAEIRAVGVRLLRDLRGEQIKLYRQRDLIKQLVAIAVVPEEKP